MGRLLGERENLKLKRFKNNSQNETYGVEFQNGTNIAVEPGDIVALTENELLVLSTSETWPTMDMLEINETAMKEMAKSVNKKIVNNRDYNEMAEIIVKTDEEIVNSACELKSLSKVKRLKEECEKANKGYLLIKELQRLIDSFGKERK